MPFIENHARSLRILFSPFTPFYAFAVRLRNRMYDKGIRKGFSFSFPVICVGNLCAGGSGKTPMTEYLVRLLCGEHAVGIVSRGYGRKTRGGIMAESGMDAEEIGDEPVQYLEEFSDTCPRGFGLYLDSDRVRGINRLKSLFPQMEVAVLDDAYQHRRARAGLNILVSDFSRPFFRDHLLPYGTLRESRRGSRRAQILVFSKCPQSLTEAQRDAFLKDFRSEPGQKVYFTTIRYGEFRPKVESGTRKVLLFTGIANPQPLEDYLRSKGYEIVLHRKFGDHHAYTESEMRDLAGFYRQIVREEGPVRILTTQKDYSRLKDTPAFAYFCSLPLSYVPVRVSFLFGGREEFDRDIRSFAVRYRREDGRADEKPVSRSGSMDTQEK